MLTIVDILVFSLSGFSLICSIGSLIYAIKLKSELQKFKEEFSVLFEKIKSYTENSSPIKDPDTNKEYVLFVKDDDLYLKQIL